MADRSIHGATMRTINLHGDFMFKAYHPITVLNPDKWFSIHEMRIESDKVWIRGKNTCWFNMAQCERETPENIRDLDLW